MNISDLAHSLLTGQWKLDRAIITDRMRLYAGANPGNRRPQAAQLTQPDDFKPAYERIILIRYARQMEEDYPFFDSLLEDFETFVVGDLRYRSSTGNTEADKRINDFLEWQFDQIDWAEKLDLEKVAKLAIRTMLRDGESGHIPVDVGDAIKLDSISGDRIGNPTLAAGAGLKDYNGIEVRTDSGAPTLYNIYRRLPKLNSYVFDRSVVPSNFFHYFNPFRFEQWHGVSAFKNVIEKGVDLKQIEDFTRLNIKWRASQLPIVQNEQGRPRGSGYEDQGTTLDGTMKPLSMKIDGVEQTFMKLGEGVVEYPNDFPNQQYGSVTTDMRRDCALGVKLPLEFAYRSDAGGVVQRFYVDKALRVFNGHKRWLKRQLLNPIKNRIIQKGIDTGYLQLPDNLARNLARFKGQWQMGSPISVDYGRETDADLKQIDAGVASEADYVLETQGRTIDEIQDQKAEFTLRAIKQAQRISKETGLSVDTVLPYLVKKFPNPAPPDQADEGADGKPSRSA
jgi:capsid protein